MAQNQFNQTPGTHLDVRNTINANAVDAETRISSNEESIAELQSSLSGIASGAEANVNADWSATSGDAEILNKPAFGDITGSDIADFAAASHTHVVADITDLNTGAFAVTGHTHTVSDITDIAANYQPLDSVLTNTTASFTTGDETKLDFISITQPVDLDAIEAANGDMLKSLYDPTNVSGDAFAMDNMVEGADTKIFTSGERDKLAGIADGAEVNVNADWDAVGGDAEILNKPAFGDITGSNIADFATSGQGALADTALQSGDNVSLLVNDTGYLLSGDNISLLTNDAGYITSAVDPAIIYETSSTASYAATVGSFPTNYAGTDGVSTSGDARGLGSIDLQMRRTSTNQVAASQYAAIGGGSLNRINSSGVNAGLGSVICGGSTNLVDNGQYAAILGGQQNKIGDYPSFAGTDSVVCGRYAYAKHNRTFVFSSEAGTTHFETLQAETFNIKASNGLRLITDGLQTAGQVLTCDANGHGTWQDAPVGITGVVDDTAPELGGNLTVSNGRKILDIYGNELLQFEVPNAFGTSYLGVRNGSVGGPSLKALGDDTDLDLNLQPKGAGLVKFTGSGGIDIQNNVIKSLGKDLITAIPNGSDNHISIENNDGSTNPEIGVVSVNINQGLTLKAKGTGNINLGTLPFDADQTVGVGQDNYVLTYDHSAGAIGLEAAAAATDTTSGIVELATQAEVDAGTDTTRVITPATLSSAAFPSATVISADSLVIRDLSDNKLKLAAASALVFTSDIGTTVQEPIDGLSLTDVGVPASNDTILVQDASDNNLKGTAVSNFMLAGSATKTHKVTTTNYTAGTNNEVIILADTSAATGANGAITINLPTASASTNKNFYVKKIDADANNVTIDGNLTETIDGAETKVISTQWDTLQIVCDGTEWFIISN